MPSVPLPKAARAAVVVALLLTLVSVISARSGPIMLLGIAFAAALSTIGMLRRRAWSAWGFALLLFLSMLAILFFALTGQSAGGFLQNTIALIIYFGIAMLFVMAGIGLSLTSAKRGTPIPWVIIALLFSAPFIFFRPMTMPSGSMENTLLVGDFLLINRFATRPAFNHIVVFHYPLDRSQVFAKRVLGVPGDRLHFANGTLYRNGTALTEPYVKRRGAGRQSELGNFPADVAAAALQPAGREMLLHNVTEGNIVVPANKYFVLGDNRDNSLDSRYWGFVDPADILGEPKLIYDSLASDPTTTSPGAPLSPPTRRWDRVFKVL